MVDVGNEKSWRSRAKVAFLPESEKMTRKAGRPCVKIKRPVFLPGALSRITTRENFGAAPVRASKREDSRGKEKERELFFGYFLRHSAVAL